MKIQRYLTGLGLWALTVVLAAVLGACGGVVVVEVTATPAVAVQSTPVEAGEPSPTLAAVEPAPTATPLPPPPPTLTPIPPEVLAAELQATVAADLPPTPTPDASGYSGPHIEGISVITLTNTTGDRPLWAAFSYGMRNFDPLQNHFVAIYSHDETGWQQLGRQELGEADYLDPASVEQVEVAADDVWLKVEGGAGAHSGVFYLLRFDGESLAVAASNFSSSPGGSRLQDLNGDGAPEVLLDGTEYYVFCYACGVRFIHYQVQRWDGNELAEVNLTLLPESAPAELRELNNRAVELAQARLLQQAESQIKQAQALDGQESTVAWNAALIDLLLQEQAESAQQGPYPLLENIFYGNYEASLELMRAYSPEEIFSQPTPLIVGTVAEMWEESVSDWLLGLTNWAIEVEPELAAAYFLRAWGEFLVNPDSPQVLADVQRAAELMPDEVLFSQSVEYLQR